MAEHELERSFDGRPDALGECAIPGESQMVADTGGDVGAHVGVELGVLDRSVAVVVRVPRTVGALRVDEPVVGAFGLVVEPGDVERHRRLDMVPRVAVTAGEPRDHPGVELERRQVVAGGLQLVGAQDAREVCDVLHRTADSRMFGWVAPCLTP